MNAIIPAANNLPARTHLGDRNEIAAVRSRLASMMQLPADVPDDVVWAAAQLAVAYKLNPFIGEIYIMDLGKTKDEVTGEWTKKYRAHIGVKGLRTLARRKANFVTEPPKEMDAAEVKRFRGENYHTNDVGVRCTLWRLDVARECKDAGIPYHPVTAMGFWRQNAQFHKTRNEWLADNIPNTWTAYQVAEKRAEINAIRMAYDLNLNVADPADAGDDETITVIQHQMDNQDVDTALYASRQLQVEDDGDILFYVEPQKRAVDATTGEITSQQAAPAHSVPPGPAPQATQPTDVDGDVLFGKDAAAFNHMVPGANAGYPWFAAARDALTPAIRHYSDAFLAQHRNNGGPCSPKQYGYLAGLLDSVIEQATGAEDGHTRVLSILCQMDVSGDNRPSATMAGRLLAKLATHKKDDAGAKIVNPDYDKATADTMVAVYLAAEAVATPSLFPA